MYVGSSEYRFLLYVFKDPFSEFNDRIGEGRCAACLGAAGDRSISSGLAWRSRREAGSSSVSWN
jgi:hypothetical protein